jgi:release factor glutamine methyltransferase
VTVLEVIQRSSAFLAKREVESPRLQVELLLAHLLKLRRMDLYLNFERTLTSKEMDDLRAWVTRRGEREPLQHIIGSACFWGLEFAVNKNVLVPRPETELLAEMGWQFLNAECGVRSAESAETTSLNALDFGTGSGCLAITLAVKCPMVKVVALDVSKEALAVAKENAILNKVDSRIQFLEGDGFGALSKEQRFDLIVSNPPYIPTAEIATLDPEVRDHDPRLALDGGVDGLDFYRRLAGEAGDYLKPNGRLMVELGAGQAPAVQDFLVAQKWIVEAVKADYNGHQRVLAARRGS